MHNWIAVCDGGVVVEVQEVLAVEMVVEARGDGYGYGAGLTSCSGKWDVEVLDFVNRLVSGRRHGYVTMLSLLYRCRGRACV